MARAATVVAQPLAARPSPQCGMPARLGQRPGMSPEPPNGRPRLQKLGRLGWTGNTLTRVNGDKIGLMLWTLVVFALTFVALRSLAKRRGWGKYRRRP